MSLRGVLTAAAVALVASVNLVAASPTCSDMVAGKKIEVEKFFTPNYLQDQTEYWSTSCGSLLPDCILVPKTAQEVATIIKSIVKYNETFAIKSGGHNPNKYWSSVKQAPLINLKGLNHVIYDAASDTVQVGPGNRWGDVAKKMEPTGKTVVGGRIGNVGVGGYIVGGGLSYLSTQYGWAMNTVLEFEVVLANGTIVYANKDQNTDLFAVLKGGGNNFGVVTSYKMKAVPMGKVWGGNLIFRGGPGGPQTQAILDAVRDFTENYPDDRAAIIATSEVTLVDLVQIWVIFLFWDGETPPPGTFDMFTSLGPIINTAKTKTYPNLLSEFDQLSSTGNVYLIATETSPLPAAPALTPGNVNVMRSYYDHYFSLAQEYKFVPGLLAVMALQPLPRRLAKLAKENGGDLLALDDTKDLMLFEFNYSYLFGTDDKKMDEAAQRLVLGMRERIDGFIANGTIESAYSPLFANDANYQQDYWGRLKSGTREYARSVAEDLDPEGLFKLHTGGWKP